MKNNINKIREIVEDNYNMRAHVIAKYNSIMEKCLRTAKMAQDVAQDMTSMCCSDGQRANFERISETAIDAAYKCHCTIRELTNNQAQVIVYKKAIDNLFMND